MLQNGLVYNPYFIWLFRRPFEGARVNEWVSEYVIRWPSLECIKGSSRVWDSLVWPG